MSLINVLNVHTQQDEEYEVLPKSVIRTSEQKQEPQKSSPPAPPSRPSGQQQQAYRSPGRLEECLGGPWAKQIDHCLPFNACSDISRPITPMDIPQPPRLTDKQAASARRKLAAALIKIKKVHPSHRKKIGDRGKHSLSSISSTCVATPPRYASLICRK